MGLLDQVRLVVAKSAAALLIVIVSAGHVARADQAVVDDLSQHLTVTWQVCMYVYIIYVLLYNASEQLNTCAWR